MTFFITLLSFIPMPSYRGKRVLVTGASGFIGKNLVPRLLEEKAVVTSLSLAAGSPFPNAEHLSVDLTNRGQTLAALTGKEFDFIFHLAANISRDSKDKEAVFAANVEGTRNLLEALRYTSYQRFVLPSTAEVYNHNAVPFVETQEAHPLSSYAQSKFQAERLCLEEAATYKKPTTIYRIAVSYGPHQKPALLIPNVILSCLHQTDVPLTLGEETRDFIYIQDLVEALLVSSKLTGKGEILNIGTGIESSVRSIAEYIHAITHSRSNLQFGMYPLRPGQPIRYCVNTLKAEQLLGWRATTSLHEGLQKTIAWYQRQQI
ncbi:NAD-dependent epimerase/dehydratase family protein [Candidatus Woesearchaeota archaeon]|nr:NAD-dependent epimerase/dehydratase family protein [Candidatus Woesearchaeota archaeon]